MGAAGAGAGLSVPPPNPGPHSGGPSRTSSSRSSSNPRRGGGCLGRLPAWSCLGARIASSLQALSLSPQHCLDFLRGLLCFKMEGNVPAKISDTLRRMECFSKAVNLLGS